MIEWFSNAWDATAHFFTDMPWQMWGVWSLTICLLLVGLVGSVIPFLPGPFLIFIAGIVHTFLRPESAMSFWGIVILSVWLVIAYVIDFAAGMMGARWFGASRWGIAGVFIGGIVGMFFGPFGLILGPIVGGIACELIFAKKQLHPAAKSAWGSLLGAGVGLVVRVIVSLAMIATFLIDALWW